MHRFVKAVGAGQKRARDLSRDEAREAMGLIADGKAQPVQVGAFLLSLRMKGECADELAGFVEALEERMTRAGAPPGTLSVDAHGDGHEGRSSALPQAACAAAALGVPVLLRVDRRNPYAKHELDAQLAALGVDLSRPLDLPRALAALSTVGVGVVDLAAYSPELAQLIALRPLFGVRTVAQTLCKLLDPMGAQRHLCGVFHAPYLPSTARALAALGRRGLCVQALGGLPEPQPGKVARVMRPGDAEPVTIDLRAATADPVLTGCATMLLSARDAPLEQALADAQAVLTDGRAAALARRMPLV